MAVNVPHIVGVSLPCLWGLGSPTALVESGILFKILDIHKGKSYRKGSTSSSSASISAVSVGPKAPNPSPIIPYPFNLLLFA